MRLDQHSEPQPDVALLRLRSDFYRQSHPTAGDVLLTIEVAESSLAYDRDLKLALYAAHGIAEAWLVDVENARLTLYRDPSGEGYRSTRTLTELRSVALPDPPGGRIDLAQLFWPSAAG